MKSSYKKNTGLLGFSATLLALAVASCGGGGVGGSDPASIAAAIPAGDHILFASSFVSVSESDRTVSVEVLRTGSAEGISTVQYRFADGSAVNGTDYTALDGELVWADGESDAKRIEFTVSADVDVETQETFTIELFDLNGSETLMNMASVDVGIDDAVCQQVGGEITGNASWTASCYHLANSAIVSNGAQLQVGPGVTVIAESRTGISVTDNATLVVSGTAADKVHFKGRSQDAGSWQGLAIISTNPLQQISHSVIDNAQIGVDLIQGASLGVFSNNEINNTALAALRLPTGTLSALDDSTHFNNNPGGIQLVASTITAANPVVLEPLATHYSTAQSLIVDGDLTLLPGVELRFGADTQIYVSQNGSLNAVGTESNPIKLTGLSTVPGFWNGIQWVHSSSQNNQLDHISIQYGGGDPARAANLIVVGAQSNLSVSNAVIRDSAGFGVIQDADAEVELENVTWGNNGMGNHDVL